MKTIRIMEEQFTFILFYLTLCKLFTNLVFLASMTFSKHFLKKIDYSELFSDLSY